MNQLGPIFKEARVESGKSLDDAVKETKIAKKYLLAIENEYSILCRIDENIYGRAVETEQVKLKKYDELLETEQSLREFDLHEQSGRKRGFPFFVIIIGALTFIILMVFLIMWFYNVF